MLIIAETNIARMGGGGIVMSPECLSCEEKGLMALICSMITVSGEYELLPEHRWGPMGLLFMTANDFNYVKSGKAGICHKLLLHIIRT